MMQQQQQQQQQKAYRGEGEKPREERKSPWPLLFAIIFVLGVAIIFIYVLLKMA